VRKRQRKPSRAFSAGNLGQFRTVAGIAPEVRCRRVGLRDVGKRDFLGAVISRLDSDTPEALALLALAVTGLAIWWPGIKTWRRSLTLQRTSSSDLLLKRLIPKLAPKPGLNSAQVILREAPSASDPSRSARTLADFRGVVSKNTVSDPTNKLSEFLVRNSN
jgi:hypothetical protein